MLPSLFLYQEYRDMSRPVFKKSNQAAYHKYMHDLDRKVNKHFRATPEEVESYEQLSFLQRRQEVLNKKW